MLGRRKIAAVMMGSTRRCDFIVELASLFVDGE
jgi:hypothetical protein